MFCKKRMIVNDHSNLRCERHAYVNGNTYFVFRVRFVESATGRTMWLTVFDQCTSSLLDVGAKDVSVMHESMQMSKLNTLVGTRVFLTIWKSKRNGYTNYNVTQNNGFYYFHNIISYTMAAPVTVITYLLVFTCDNLFSYVTKSVW